MLVYCMFHSSLLHLQLLPDVTRYKYSHAKKHCEYLGVGEPVQTCKLSREKFKTDQLDHFIDFITSKHIIKDQPFGEKTLRLTTGEIIKIPSVIRSLAPSNIISQYLALCKEDIVIPLGEFLYTYYELDWSLYFVFKTKCQRNDN